MGKTADRLKKQLKECSWLHNRAYGEIVGKEIADASMSDLEDILTVLENLIEDAKGSEDLPFQANPYKVQYFSGIATLVKGFIEARQSVPSRNMILDKEHIFV